jgi:nicotinate-nucleotide pyrophosphorylase (carboxylating)
MPVDLAQFVNARDASALIARARAEDLGPDGRDVTSELLIDTDRTGEASIRSRVVGRLCGAALLPAVVEAYDPTVALDAKLDDGARLIPGSIIAAVRGPLRSLLAIERVALNLLTHLSGIATLTARHVEAVGGTKARIYDTRKTHAGLRNLEKYAVACGGGHPHRMGLHDAVLVKDNHIAHVPPAELGDRLAALVAEARAVRPAPAFVEIEVDTLEQLKLVLPAGPDIVLLDNMKLDQLRSAVSIRDRMAPGVELEASGGVNLETVTAIARTGVDRIAVGAITHSAPALDIGMDIL